MPQMSRLDLRVPLYVKETIDFAAALEGRTRTDFLIEAAVDKARKVIAENRVIELSLKDQQLLADDLANDNIKEADSFLKDLADKYRDAVIKE